jgi:hypothetical protein
MTGLTAPKSTFITLLPRGINSSVLSGLDHEQNLNNKRFAVDCKARRNPYACLSRFSRLVSLAGSFLEILADCLYREYWEIRVENLVRSVDRLSPCLCVVAYSSHASFVCGIFGHEHCASELVCAPKPGSQALSICQGRRGRPWRPAPSVRGRSTDTGLAMLSRAHSETRQQFRHRRDGSEGDRCVLFTSGKLLCREGQNSPVCSGRYLDSKA